MPKLYFMCQNQMTCPLYLAVYKLIKYLCLLVKNFPKSLSFVINADSDVIDVALGDQGAIHAYVKCKGVLRHTWNIEPTFKESMSRRAVEQYLRDAKNTKVLNPEQDQALQNKGVLYRLVDGEVINF